MENLRPKKNLPILGDHAVLLGCLSSVHNTEDVGGHAVVGAQVGERFNGLGQLVPVVLCWLVVISESVVELQAVLLQCRHHPSPLLDLVNSNSVPDNLERTSLETTLISEYNIQIYVDIINKLYLLLTVARE